MAGFGTTPSNTFFEKGMEQHYRKTGQLDEGQPVLFDVAWEVARKVGGIYTVLRSKAPVTVEEYGSRYACIGPYNPETAPTEFEPIAAGPLTAPVIDVMKEKYGIIVHFGKWLVEGYPKTFLIDLNCSMDHLDMWRHELMPGFEAPHDNESNDSIVFGYQTALFLKEFAVANKAIKVIAHFHEWQSAVGLLVASNWGLPIATIFTTHATLLGRYMSAGGMDLYNQLPHINVDAEASKRGIYHRHWIEQRAAQSATVFTTVSDITAYEAELALKRKADVILPNGLKLEKFNVPHEFQGLHAKYKSAINEFVRGHFFGHYDFNLDNTVYFFTAGRYEYYNKGVDMYIESLVGLNELLKQQGSKLTVVAFIIMPAKTNNFNVESLKGHSFIRDMRKTVGSIVESVSERMFDAIAQGQLPRPEELLREEEIVMLKRRIYTLKQRPALPPIVTHNMVFNDTDEILSHLRRKNLFNSSSDRVKIIYHPEFLSSTSPLLPLDYTDFVRGCHLGVFPSYYEPWGYTPAECTVLGVPSITSNLTGFANFMKRRLDDPDSKGIFVVDRRFKAPHESIEQITNIMWRFCQLDRRERIELRNRTERLSELLDWKSLGQAYSSARTLALERSAKAMASITGASLKPPTSSPSPSPTPIISTPTITTTPASSSTSTDTKTKVDVEGATKRVVGWNLKSDS
eukprot:Phypoly_transcript_03775.p1 GENE.Phypoly_transcript_03775~~Phypoly_transcript_03775.p1  ORF type:complete len:686 (+),score=116.66 Phypoly_transcript_03775:101-2158(+)